MAVVVAVAVDVCAVAVTLSQFACEPLAVSEVAPLFEKACISQD